MLCVAVLRIAGLQYLVGATEHVVQLCSSPGWSASQLVSVPAVSGLLDDVCNFVPCGIGPCSTHTLCVWDSRFQSALGGGTQRTWWLSLSFLCEGYCGMIFLFASGPLAGPPLDFPYLKDGGPRVDACAPAFACADLGGAGCFISVCWALLVRVLVCSFLFFGLPTKYRFHHFPLVVFPTLHLFCWSEQCRRLSVDAAPRCWLVWPPKYR